MPIAKQQGYLEIDHRSSPGIPAELARIMGLDPKQMGEGCYFETETLTCSHCKTSQIKNTLRSRERGFCTKCYHYICDGCNAQSLTAEYQHMPFEKLIDITRDLAERGTPTPLSQIITL